LVTACLENPLPVAHHGVGRNRDDGPGIAAPPHGLDHVCAADGPGQFNVEQDQIDGGIFGQQFQRTFTIFPKQDRMLFGPHDALD
jgi:hypothetical protein